LLSASSVISLRASLSQKPDNHRDCGETAAAAEQQEQPENQTHFARAPFFFVGSDSEIIVGVGAVRAINTAKLVGGGNAAPQPTINRPNAHAAHFFSFPVLLSASSVISQSLLPYCGQPPRFLLPTNQ
jgi:hypothetical protein